MTDKKLINTILKEYKFDDGYYLLQKSAVYIKEFSKNSSRRKDSKRVYLEIESSLERLDFNITPDELAKRISTIKKPQLDDKELSTFHYAVCKCVFLDLLKRCSVKNGSAENKKPIIPKSHKDLLSMLEAFDFEEFYKEQSSVHRILQKSNPCFYRQSDELTQKHIRRYVYSYAKKQNISEISAAKIYGKEGARPKKGAMLYFPFILTLCLVLSVILSFKTGFLAAIFLFLPILESLRITLVTVLSKTIIPSKILSADIRSVPDKGRTIAVITTLIDKNSTSDILKKIEDYHNRTRDENVCFGILADLPDSREYYSNNDENDISDLVSRFGDLNKKYGDSFCLFIRTRSYISTEQRYSGRERKRGAVLSLCSLLTKNGNEFDTVVCPKPFLEGSSYLITLDSDTEIGMGDVCQMVAAMLHPSNKPIIKDGRVVSGHAILQPKTAPSVKSASKTPFTLVTSGCSGNDGYKNVDFELYQTLFGRSTFCGKGIIDIRAFHSLFDGLYKEERILSHDTLEGGIGRCGYISHVCLADSCPKNPISYYKRYHRWLRGDTQSLGFIGKRIANAKNKKIKNPLDPLGKIMVLDNFLHALLPISTFIALVISFFAPSGRSAIIVITAILPILLPFITSFLNFAIPSPIKFYSNTIKNIFREFCRMIFELSAIPTKFLISFDAIFRAAWRMTVSKKHLMQWVTAEAAEKLPGKFLGYFLRFFFSFALGIVIPPFTKNSFLDFFAILWSIFFLLCYCLGSEYPERRKISEKNKSLLKKYSLDCWYYFSHNVNASSNHLPPDNLQISPVKRIAMRTSPTNIGLYLLCCGAAYRFSFIGIQELKSRISNTLKVIDTLPKYKGHLYNWYDINTLNVLGHPYVSTVDSGNFLACVIALMQMLKGINGGVGFEDEIEKLNSLYEGMSFRFLYNERKKLFAIGMDTSTEKLGDGCYDILMSEVRTAVYIAICKGEISPEVYYKMGRPIITQNGHIGLSSWSGTAFEYFMPALFLPVIQNTLDYESLGFALSCQIADKHKGVWGRSECGYYAFDHEMNYQYQASGTPALAIDPEIAKYNVIAPYASFLSLCMSYRHPCANLERLEQMDTYGKYGFYEAIDFSKKRVGNGSAVIYSWMSHHLGMSILAAANACFEDYVVKSFMSHPVTRCGVPLLEMKIPVDIRLSREMQKRKEPVGNHYHNRLWMGNQKVQPDPNTLPESSCYSNSVMGFTAMSNGAIRLKYKSFAISHPFFHQDHLLRSFGIRIKTDDKITNPISGACFSSFLTGVCYQKQEHENKYQVSFALHGEINAICVNLTVKGRFDKVSSMLVFEPVLDSVPSFEAHPAFSGLGIDCKYDNQTGLLIFKRKLREDPHRAIYTAIGTANGGRMDYITRRDTAFNTHYNYRDLDNLIDQPFDNRDGACINPLCAVRISSTIKDKTAKQNKDDESIYSINFVIYSADSLGEIYSAQNKLKHDKAVHTKGYIQAFSSSLETLAREQLAVARADKEVIELCSALRSDFAINPYKQKQDARLSHTHLLYKYGISNDLPIVCLEIEHEQDQHIKKTVELFSQANRYMRCLGEPFDLVVISCREKEGNDYFSPQKNGIKNAIEVWSGPFGFNQRGGVFLIDFCEDGEMIRGLARLHFVLQRECVNASIIKSIKNKEQESQQTVKSLPGNNVNSTKGSFLENGFEIRKGRSIRPWSYTYSSRIFGTLITQNSLGFSWYKNSRQARLTPWSNDPLLELSGEILVLKISDTEYDLAAISSRVVFKRGQACYYGCVGGIDYTIQVGISINLPFKYLVFRAVNDNPEKISFSVYYKITPALGSKEGCNYKITENDDLAVYTNVNTAEMGNICMFLYGKEQSFTLDRAGQCHASFILGAFNKKRDKGLYHMIRICEEKLFENRLEKEYGDYFEKITNVFKLKSSNPELDQMFNFYAPYQAYCQRILARSGFYQSGGAYGFRDQLQDALCMVSTSPEVLKNQLLRCASKQFIEGDVLHWWHETPNSSSGVFGIRTKCSDDYLWLAYCTAIYIKATGDASVLDYKLPYLQGDTLGENEQERGMTAVSSDKKETLYYHCIRAISLSLSKRSKEGLCYIGSCDWNDGFSNVGVFGKGTSVWLTRFLQLTLSEFAPFCQRDYKEYFCREIEALDRAVEEHGYNGDYYIRGYFDNGDAIGDKDSEECKIDILPQAFSAITNGKNERTKKAMKNAIDMLYDRDNKLLSLFTPPFESSDLSPGYVMAYVPGTRENGGQYTHGALWGAIGCFCLGENKLAFDILNGSNPAYRSCHTILSKSYGAEPYAFAGDIYTNPSHLGRAGWTQYTGAAGWFYQTVLNYLVGYREHQGVCFTVEPHLSKSFSEFTLTISKKDTVYEIQASYGDKTEYLLDGKIVDNRFIFDKEKHFLKITVEKK